jgi:hypothetical protein
VNTPTTSDATCIIEGGNFFKNQKKGTCAGPKGWLHILCMGCQARARVLCVHSTLRSEVVDPGTVHT